MDLYLFIDSECACSKKNRNLVAEPYGCKLYFQAFLDKTMSKILYPTVAALTMAAGAMAQERPNIIVFLVDDMGLMDTSVPFITDAEGNPQRQPLNDWYRTPNMERLASQGVRFSTFYA